MTPGQLKLAIGAATLLGAIVLAGVVGYRQGAAGARADWNADKLAQAEAQKAAVLAAVAANEAEHLADVAATRAVMNDYMEKLHESQDRIATERAALDRGRLRIAIPARVCAAAPAGEATGTGPADGAAGVESVELPAAVERGLRDVAERADREVAGLQAQLEALQEWVLTHGFYERGR